MAGEKKTKKALKTEALDMLQYFYRTVHDPLIRGLIRFSGQLDEAALKKAVSLSKAALPLLGCCFDTAARRPRWKEMGFSGADIVQVIEAGPDPAAQAEKLLASTIAIAREPQLKIFLLRDRPQARDTLCIIINHMACDGAGFKEYLYLLGDLYTRCHDGCEPVPRPESASRSAMQLFARFGIMERLLILLSKNPFSVPQNGLSYPLQGDAGHPFLVTRRIASENFLRVKGYAKGQGVTVNDLLLTAYVRVLRQVTGRDTITVPCPVDLRKYLAPRQKYGICNLTGNLTCNVTLRENEAFADTLLKVAAQMNEQKSRTDCLKGILLLELIHRVLPFRAVQKILRKLYRIPVISFTNLGIIDQELLHFGDSGVSDAFITGAVKYVPYFQIAVSSYNDQCTLSSNLHGTAQDKLAIEQFLLRMEQELLSR